MKSKKHEIKKDEISINKESLYSKFLILIKKIVRIKVYKIKEDEISVDKEPPGASYVESIRANRERIENRFYGPISMISSWLLLISLCYLPCITIYFIIFSILMLIFRKIQIGGDEYFYCTYNKGMEAQIEFMLSLVNRESSHHSDITRYLEKIMEQKRNLIYKELKYLYNLIRQRETEEEFKKLLDKNSKIPHF